MVLPSLVSGIFGGDAPLFLKNPKERMGLRSNHANQPTQKAAQLISDVKLRDDENCNRYHLLPHGAGIDQDDSLFVHRLLLVPARAGCRQDYPLSACRCPSGRTWIFSGYDRNRLRPQQTN